MAVDQQQLGQAIYDLIFDSLTMAPAGSLPAMTAGSTMLSLSLPGLPLDPAEFGNPWTPMNPGGDPVTAENFAWLVDAVPEVSPIFTPNGNSIETLYGEIVQANTPSAAPAGPAPPPTPAPLPAHSPGAARPAAGNRLVGDAAGRGLISSRRRAIQLLSPKVRSAFGRLYTEGTLPMPRGGSLKTFIETPEFRTYLDLRMARDEAVTRYMAQLLQTNLNDPADEQRWAQTAVRLEQQVKSTARAVEDASGAQIEEAMAALAASEDDGQNNSVAAIFDAARLNFELSKLGSMLGPGYTWHMTLAQPQNWFTAQAPFFDVDLRSSRGLRIDRESRFRRLGGQAALGSGLWGYRAQDKTLRQPIAQESSDIRVRFRFARINIRRPWLDTSLFSIGGWAMAGRRRNDLSTGSLIGNTGIFPLLPSSIIIARDLQIAATWSQSDASFIRERLHQQDLAFGPFALAGHYRRPGAKAATVTHATFDGVNIIAPGLQVIGWMSKLVPACPPLNG
jgi:hypothetical protein